MTAELIIDSKSILGEGPVWHQDLKCLFWVDIEGKKICKYNTENNQLDVRHFKHMPGALAPMNNETFLIAFDNGLAIYNWQTDSIEYKNKLGSDKPEIRANDGKCDPNGNFWIGTMHLNLKPNVGALYQINTKFETILKISERTISNGMAWSKNGTVMYYIDTSDNNVVAYDFNCSTGQISNKKIVIEIDPEMGSLDGMTIDENDNLWIAHWGGFCVRQWNSKTGRVMNVVELPVPHVTSCIFGGTNFDELYITSARSGLSKKELLKYPLSGGVFKVKTGSVGRPSIFFKGKGT